MSAAKGRIIDLDQLQSLVKRDPVSYKLDDEFSLQLSHFQSLQAVFLLKPTEKADNFQKLVHFLSHVAPCYPDQCRDVPIQLMRLLEEQAYMMSSSLRTCLVKALILLANREMLASTALLPLLFRLFRCPDKNLRQLLYSHIVHDIKRANAKQLNNKLNSAVQAFLYKILRDNNEFVAGKSMDIIMELYRRNVWTDAKTVNLVVSACFSKHAKVVAKAVRFFITSENVSAENADEASEKKRLELQERVKVAEQRNHTFSKRSRTRRKKIRAELKVARRDRQDHINEEGNSKPNFSALQLVYDPQTFAEKLLRELKKSNAKFEMRLLMMNLISRLIACHELILYNFYPYLQKYVRPSQEHVTYIMAVMAQSVHSLVDPEEVQPLLRAVANNFVADRSRVEVVTIGLNVIREMCARQPLLMDHDLLNDLTEYAKHRDKNVTAAAKSLLNLYRAVNPTLLHRRKRGKKASIDPAKALAFGEIRTASGVEGAELLAEAREARANEEFSNEDSSAEMLEASEEDEKMGFFTDRGNDVVEDEVVLDVDSAQSAHEDEEEDKPKFQHFVNGFRDQNTTQETATSTSTAASSTSTHTSTHTSTSTSTSTNINTSAYSVDPSLPVERRRILTEDDFELIREQQQKLAEEGTLSGKKRKHRPVSNVVVPDAAETRVALEAIEPDVKKSKSNKEERVAIMNAGKEDRPKFGSRKNQRERTHGDSNRQKLQNKPFLLVKNSSRVRAKVLESLRAKRDRVRKKKQHGYGYV